MSTKFYIKDENGSYLSIDGKTRYSCLEGMALYDFLKTEDGKRRSFHVDIDEDGNKIGIEASLEFLKKEESEKNHSAYLERQKAESGIEVISANIVVRDSESNMELIETVADITMNVELKALKAIDLQNLRKALGQLSKDEYDLIFHLFLADEPMTERQYGAARGIPQKTVNCRKKVILGKLKKYL